MRAIKKSFYIPIIIPQKTSKIIIKNSVKKILWLLYNQHGNQERIYNEIPFAVYDYIVFRVSGRSLRTLYPPANRRQYLRIIAVIYRTVFSPGKIKMGRRYCRLVSQYNGAFLKCQPHSANIFLFSRRLIRFFRIANNYLLFLYLKNQNL